MATPGGADDFNGSLASMRPTARQSIAAWTIVALLFLTFVATVPFATVPLPQLEAFVPSLLAVVSVTDLITAILLFGHFFSVGTCAILVLAAGYLFSSLIVLPYALAFPGAFAPAGVFGDARAVIWLYIFWHVGFVAAVVAYTLLKDRRPDKTPARISASSLFTTIAIVVVTVAALTVAAEQFERLLPAFGLTMIRDNAFIPYAAAACSALSALAALLLWWRGRSILDLWVMVAVCAGITGPLLSGFFSPARFSVGFYASRGYTLVTSTIVLAVLLSEAAILYARLSRMVALLQHERDSKLTNLEAVVATISHEVRQPLAAIATNGSAALLFLEKSEPNLAETRAALSEIVQDSMNANQIFEGIRRLFKGADQDPQAVDLNAIVYRALHMLRSELKDNDVAVAIELASGLPFVSGHKGQLLEVVLNLLNNSVDAMRHVTSQPKLIRVKTGLCDGDAITLSVEDTGPGIDPKKADAIFDAFVSTKKTGMGLGLAISRMIVERYGGRISATSAPDKGALFQVVLPMKSGLAA